MTTVARVFLAEHYAPHGTRMQLLLLPPVSTEVDHFARELVAAHGLEPIRRVATLNPRPGESDLRSEDVVQYMQRYGHEYSVGWGGDPAGLDRARIDAEAAAVGCVVGWSD